MFTAVLLAMAICLCGQKPPSESHPIGAGPILLGNWEIGGRAGKFMFDTGSSLTSLSDAWAESLGEPVERVSIRNSSSNANAPLYKPPVLMVGNRKLTIKRVMMADMGPLSAVVGDAQSGILGMNAITDNDILDIDFEKRTWIIAGSYAAPKSDKWVSVPLRISPKTRCPEIIFDLPAIGRTAFTVDTGYIGTTSGMLSSETVEQLATTGVISEVATSIARGADGDIQTSKYRIHASSRLSDISWEGLVFERGDMNLVSLWFFSRFSQVVFDFPGGNLHLKKGNSLHKPDLIPRSGFSFIKRAGKYRVVMLGAGSPASKVGLAVDDMLVAVDGRPAIEMEAYAIRQLLSGPVILDGKPRTVRLGFQRGDKTFEATLDLTVWPEIDLTPPKRLPPDLQPAP